MIQAPLDGAEREPRVVLAARQALFLHGADGHAIDHERGRGVVVMRGDAENLHRQYWLLERCRVGAIGVQPTGSRALARLASHAKGGSTMK